LGDQGKISASNPFSRPYPPFQPPKRANVRFFLNDGFAPGACSKRAERLKRASRSRKPSEVNPAKLQLNNQQQKRETFTKKLKYFNNLFFYQHIDIDRFSSWATCQ
jgi:hypothetical protein